MPLRGMNALEEGIAAPRLAEGFVELVTEDFAVFYEDMRRDQYISL